MNVVIFDENGARMGAEWPNTALWDVAVPVGIWLRGVRVTGLLQAAIPPSRVLARVTSTAARAAFLRTPFRFASLAGGDGGPGCPVCASTPEQPSANP